MEGRYRYERDGESQPFREVFELLGEIRLGLAGKARVLDRGVAVFAVKARARTDELLRCLLPIGIGREQGNGQEW